MNSSANARNFDRYNVSSYAVVISNNQQRRVLIQDFSRMGVGFVIDDIIHFEKFISLLYQNENQQIINMKSYVRHARKLKDGLYFVGVQFIGIESKYDRAA
jgi:c-di-GMP-binding flagellar brake protein YcgR